MIEIHEVSSHSILYSHNTYDCASAQAATLSRACALGVQCRRLQGKHIDDFRILGIGLQLAYDGNSWEREAIRE